MFHQQEEVIGGGQAWLEVELPGPGARPLILRMHEQRLAQPLALLGSGDRKTSGEHHRDRMTGKPLADQTWSVGMFDDADREAATPDDALLAATDDMGLSAACFLVDQRVALQQSIERVFAAIKRADVVGGAWLSGGAFLRARRLVREGRQRRDGRVVEGARLERV